MTKKERQSYDKMIDGIADEIVFSAYRQALDITDDVYLDILIKMKLKVDDSISKVQKIKQNKVK